MRPTAPGALRHAKSQQAPCCSAADREGWAAGVRSVTRRQKHRVWAPELSPPPLLSDVAVVLVSPKSPFSVGVSARACNAFEAGDLRLVAPRCDPLARAARNGSKGAQYLLWRAGRHEQLQEALEGVAFTVAFARWAPGHAGKFFTLPELLASQRLHGLLSTLPPPRPGAAAAEAAGGDSRSPPGPALALVFGREEAGLADDELAACDAVCSIPIGRLQESLSLSHAVGIVLAQLFQRRLAAAPDPATYSCQAGPAGAEPALLPELAAHLAASTERGK